MITIRTAITSVSLTQLARAILDLRNRVEEAERAGGTVTSTGGLYTQAKDPVPGLLCPEVIRYQDYEIKGNLVVHIAW